jgi:hypothetical protein
MIVRSLFSALLLLAAGDPFAGTWKLNVAKSKLPPPLPLTQLPHGYFQFAVFLPVLRH